VVEAVTRRLAGLGGASTMLPTEDAAVVGDELARRFTQQAQAKGAHVFRTSDPQAVREYILNLAAAKGFRPLADHGLRRVLEAGYSIAFPGTYLYLHGRMLWADAVAVAEARQGLEQLVILGAGYDTRFHRLREVLRGGDRLRTDGGRVSIAAPAPPAAAPARPRRSHAESSAAGRSPAPARRVRHSPPAPALPERQRAPRRRPGARPCRAPRRWRPRGAAWPWE